MTQHSNLGRILFFILTMLIGITLFFSLRAHGQAPAHSGSFAVGGFNGLVLDSKTELVSSELKDGKLTLTWKSWTACMSAVYPPCPGHTSVWKDVYASSNGVVVLEQRINGTFTPAVTTPEAITFPTNAPGGGK